MDRLSGLDASFLYLESPEQLMHVCALVVLDPETIPGGYEYGRFRDALGARTRDIEMFTRKIRRVPMDLDHPIWVEDTHFDIDRHVHRATLPGPGGQDELNEFVGHIAGIGLDRSRPLWEMWVIEGLASGQVAVLAKMHHASVDGVNGANALSVLCSLEPGAEMLDLMPAPTTGRDPGSRELLVRGTASFVARPFRLVGMVKPTVGAVTRTAQRARKGVAMAAPLTAPRTSFNGTITGHRSVAFADLSLDTVRAVKNAVPGSTVNDVVLALCGGALRRYLADRGELPTISLLAAVPVSVHDTSQREGGRNKVSTMFARLGTDIADERERLESLAVANGNAKEHHQAIPADTLQDWAQFAAPRTFGLGVRVVSGLRLAERGPVIHNLIISNVPGPPVPLYFLGARIEALYPLGPVFHGAGLNITVVSNNGRLHVGVIACRESMPHPDLLASEFEKELAALAAAVGADPGIG